MSFRLQTSRALDDDSAAPAYRKPAQPGWAPLHWVHVPKCGSGFGNSLIHVPQACIGVTEDYQCSDLWGECEGIQDMFCPLISMEGFGGHMGINSHYDTWKGRLVTMLRQPEQRLLSSYYYAVSLNGEEAARYDNAMEFAVANAGVITKMLTHDGDFTWGHEGHPVNTEDADLAATRVEEGFWFLGLLEEWDRSICLFNVMFNMDCMELQFSKTNPTSRSASVLVDNVTGLYDESPLQGFKDMFDAQPYKAGLAFFQAKVEAFGISDASCGACYEQAMLASK